jgi:hypothetical protein
MGLLLGLVLGTSGPATAQGRRPASPSGASATEVLGHFDERRGYVDGRWIEIRYGRPVKRGRDLFGPDDFAEALNDGAPVWRAGANVSTQLNTQVALDLGGVRVPPGTYTVFIELSRDQWTFILSNWPAQTTYDDKNTAALWGAYEYTSDRDVVRVPMALDVLPHAFEQLTWAFLDMSDQGGRLAIFWDTMMASVPFTIVPAPPAGSGR